MSKRKKQPHPDRPLPLKWEFGPDIPTYDYIKDHRIDDSWGSSGGSCHFHPQDGRRTIPGLGGGRG